MDILPVLRALRHHKVGPLLIALQIALTLAIVANSVFIVQLYLRQIDAPSGIDEANIFTMSNEWATEPGDLAAQIRGDLAALRSLPGVIDAEGTEDFPLCNCGGTYYLALKNEKTDRYHGTSARTYLVDDHGLNVYGLSLITGRWFNAAEVGTVRPEKSDIPVAVVVTKHLADELFPSGDALGQLVYVSAEKPSRIVGIVRSAISAYFDAYHQEDAAFVPLQYLNSSITYVVRTRPGMQKAVMQLAQDRLYRLTRQRVIENVRTFAETRRYIALDMRTDSVMLIVICAVLLTMTVLGIVGLTQFWVSRRRRYIGMRRALGARRVDILKYFHSENLLIAGGGCLLGIALGLAGNVWLLTSVNGLERMSLAYASSWALLVLAASQGAVLWPALRAACVPPAIASRGL